MQIIFLDLLHKGHRWSSCLSCRWSLFPVGSHPYINLTVTLCWLTFILLNACPWIFHATESKIYLLHLYFPRIYAVISRFSAASVRFAPSLDVTTTGPIRSRGPDVGKCRTGFFVILNLSLAAKKSARMFSRASHGNFEKSLQSLSWCPKTWRSSKFLISDKVFWIVEQVSAFPRKYSRGLHLTLVVTTSLLINVSESLQTNTFIGFLFFSLAACSTDLVAVSSP